MISFIVIGRNIENTIELCLNSVIRFIDLNQLEGSEVLYVDSDSSDRSVELAQRLATKVFIVQGKVNAAIGRNVGARNSSGKTLVFLDGDMELLPEFYQKLTQPDGSLPGPFITGYWEDWFYDPEFNLLEKKPAKIIDDPIELSVTGGLMIIDKALWNRVGGMDERLVRSQDHDLGLRLKTLGFPVVKHPFLFAVHHTISYFQANRLSQFFGGTTLFSQGLMMRKHFFDFNYLIRFKHVVLYTAMLSSALVFTLIKVEVSFILAIAYVAIQAVRAVKSKGLKNGVVETFTYHFLYNIYVLVGVLFYYPNHTPSYTVKTKICQLS
jgi:glycosyltransferase involved in cell wall biosynthesis